MNSTYPDSIYWRSPFWLVGHTPVAFLYAALAIASIFHPGATKEHADLLSTAAILISVPGISLAIADNQIGRNLRLWVLMSRLAIPAILTPTVAQLTYWNIISGVTMLVAFIFSIALFWSAENNRGR